MWREVDWNWQAFSWTEWTFLVFAVLWLAFWVPAGWFIYRGVSVGDVVFGLAVGVSIIAIAGGWVVLSLRYFGRANRRRQGFPEPELKPMWTNQTRPISIRRLRLVLVGGFLATALVVLTLLWLGPR